MSTFASAYRLLRRSLLHGRYGLVVILGILAVVAIAADYLPVSGGKLAWTGRLPSGWMGGNARQIERIAAGTQDKTLRFLMSEMLLDAQNLDVYFTHMDVTGTSTRTLSSLRVNVVRLGSADLTDASKRGDLWQAYARLLREQGGSGSAVAVTDDRVTTTAGRPAYEVTFKTSLGGSGTFYTLMHFVTLPDGTQHLFQLKADSVKFGARKADLHELLSSIKYR